MSTIGYTDWAVDLANVGPIYPFQGSEIIMVAFGTLFWLLWHVLQLSIEQWEIDDEVNHKDRAENIRRSLENY